MIERIFLGASDSGGPFWVAFYNVTMTIYQNTDVAGIAVDQNLNVYFAATLVFNNTNRLVKLTRTGSIDWQNQLTTANRFYNDVAVGGGRTQGKTISIDSSGDIYTRFKLYSGFSNNPWGSMKFTAAGAQTWSRQTPNEYFNGGFHSLNTAGNWFAVTMGGSGQVMVRIDNQSDGTSSKRFIISSTAGWVLRPCSFASNGPNWTSHFGYIDRGGNGNWLYRQTWIGSSVVNHNTWGVDPALGWTFLQGHDSALGNDLETVMVGRSGSGFGGWVAKSPIMSQAITWMRSFASCQLDQVVVDSANNVIVAGTIFSGSYPDSIFVAKLNSSGTVQWQRKMTISGYSALEAYNVAVDLNGNIYLGMNGQENSTSTNKPIIAKLAGDGSGIGTSGIITYSSHSATVNTSNFLVDVSGESQAGLTITQSDLANDPFTNPFIPTSSTNTVVTLS